MIIARFCIVAASLWLPLLAQPYSFQAIPVAGHFTRATAITNSGVVLGSAVRMPAGDIRPFWRSPSGEMHFPQAPALSYWDLLGINNSGDVVGTYGVAVNGLVRGYGLVIRDGISSTIHLSDLPDHPRTTVTGINERGDFAGYYYDSALGEVGFLNSGGVVSVIQFPGAVATHLQAIAWDGTIVGCYQRSGSNGLFNAFLRGPKGNFLELKIAGADGVCALGSNNVARKIVGFAQYEGQFSNRIYRGFVYDYGADLEAMKTPAGARTMDVVFVDYPGGNGTIVSGINGKGTIVGWSGTLYGYGTAFIGTPQP